MRKINYKCPSCGGKVDYGDNNVLICTYCNKVFDSVIKNELDVNNIVEKMEVYAYYCRNCNYEYKTKNNISGTTLCPKCNQKLEKDKQIINGLIPMNMTKEEAKKKFYKDFKKIIPKEYFEGELKLEYIRCRVYEGTIKITTKRKSGTTSKIYYIYDLPIPTNKKFNYNHKKSLMYINLDTKNAIYSKKKLENIIDIESLCIDLSKETEIEELKEACKRKLKNTAKEINVEASIDVKHNLYLPAYSISTVYYGITYSNYIFSVGNEVIFCCDNIDFNIAKYNRYKIRNSIMMIALFLLYLLVLCSKTTSDQNPLNPDSIFSPTLFFLITTIIFGIATGSIYLYNSYKNKKLQQSLSIRKITKKEYYDSVIERHNKD